MKLSSDTWQKQIEGHSRDNEDRHEAPEANIEDEVHGTDVGSVSTTGVQSGDIGDISSTFLAQTHDEPKEEDAAFTFAVKHSKSTCTPRGNQSTVTRWFRAVRWDLTNINILPLRKVFGEMSSATDRRKELHILTLTVVTVCSQLGHRFRELCPQVAGAGEVTTTHVLRTWLVQAQSLTPPRSPTSRDFLFCPTQRIQHHRDG